MTQYGFFIDQSRCIGCNSCTVSCMQWHDIPPGAVKWMRVYQWEKGVFPATRLHMMPVPCYHCENPVCAKACPTRAISGKPAELNLEKREFSIGRIDSYACDWAKRYCLSGKEGAQYFGLDVDVPVPKAQTAEALAEAVASVKWGVQKRLLDVVPECLRVCPAHKMK